MNEAQRASLVESHRFLVWKAVRTVWPRVKTHIEKSELVSLADMGLVEAASRWDPDANVPFAVYAWYRVQGAILDGIRAAVNIPRRVWTQLVALRAAGEYLEARARRETAARRKGAGSLASTVEQLREIKEAMASVEAIYATSMRVSLDEGEHSPEPEETVGEAIDRSTLRDRMDQALADLPEKERALMRMHYFEGKNLLEAGEALGISKSWASRLHAQAVDRLRRRLGRDIS